MTRTWWENEEILGQFRDWLSQTAQEIEALDESPESFAVDPSQWNESAQNAPAVGMLQLVEALTAMRHEIKLQTKSSRGLEESVEAARQALDEAMRQFRSVQSREAEAAERASLPLAEALADLDEAMWRAGKAFESAHRQMTSNVPQRVRCALAEEFQSMPRWRRWLVGGWSAHLEQRCAEVIASLNAEEFSSLLDGYRFIQERLRQTIERQGLRRIDVLGRPIDPAYMTVVAIADNSSAPPETVVEEFRPSYQWRDKVIRFAEVRATLAKKSPVTPET